MVLNVDVVAPVFVPFIDCTDASARTALDTEGFKARRSVGRWVGGPVDKAGCGRTPSRGAGCAGVNPGTRGVQGLEGNEAQLRLGP